MIFRRLSFALAFLCAFTQALVLSLHADASKLGNTALPRSTPEFQAVHTEGLVHFFDAIEAKKLELHSIIVVRHGNVIVEAWWAPYGPQLNHTMYSMSKSFTSTAVGLAINEGKLKLDDPVISFFPNDLPAEISANLKSLRVRDLLCMSAGQGKDPTFDTVKSADWAKDFLAKPFDHEPGTKFLYNSIATYMCSAIVQKVTGQTVHEYLKARLFEPLGITGTTWEVSPQGINTGGWGLGITTEGLAKFGQLLLQKGKWNDRQIVPATWVETATTTKIMQPEPAKPSRPNADNDWLQGYGFQFWRCRHHAYRGDGAFGQYTIVMPEQDAVVAITSEVNDMQGLLDLVWEHLLPAMGGRESKLEQAGEDLRKRLPTLALPAAEGKPTSPTADRISGKAFEFEDNALGLKSVVFNFTGDSHHVTFRTADAGHTIPCGLGGWQNSEIALPGTPPRFVKAINTPEGVAMKAAASAGWKDENTLGMIWRYIETPHSDRVACQFEGETVRITFSNSVGKDSRPVLIGKMVARP